MPKPGKPIPDGYNTVNANLTVKGADEAIDFYKKAFGAELRERVVGPDGKSVVHAEITIGSSLLMISEECVQSGCLSAKSMNGSPVSFYVYVNDVDSVFARAVSAGATMTQPLTDMFWGDRCGQVQDPFGYKWALATHKEDLTKEELAERQAKWFAEFSKNQK